MSEMPSFHHGPVEIAYLDTEGSGEPIVLVHGFGSTKEVNWVNPGWVDTLTKAGRRVIALDNRGHGESAKLYKVEQYDRADMAEDVRALMDHLKIERADVMGYSMGARITTNLVIAHQARVRSAILGGIGVRLVTGGGLPEPIARALETDEPDEITDPQGIMFRRFADQTKSDRLALAACLRGSRRLMTREEAAAIKVPTLIAVGTTDDVAGSAHELGQIIPGSQVLDIPNRDHMRAVGDRVYKDGVLEFLAKRP